MKKIVLLSLFTIYYSIGISIAQNKTIDSLLKVLNNSAKALTDAEKIDVYYGLCSEYETIGEYTKGLQYGTDGLLIAQQTKDKKQEANFDNSLGNIYSDQSDYEKALDCFNKSLVICKAVGDMQGMAMVYNNIGSICETRTEYPKALDYFNKALVINQTLKSRNGIQSAYSNIGLIYMDLSNYPLALNYFNKSLQLDLEIDNKQGMAIDYNNIGDIYKRQGDSRKALEYDFMSLKLSGSLGDKANTANNYYDIGKIFLDQSNYPKSLDYFLKSLNIYQAIGDKAGMAKNYKDIGNIYSYQPDYPKSLEYYFKSLKIAEELGDKIKMSENYTDIGIILMGQGDYTKSLDYYFKSLNINKTSEYKKGECNDYNNLGDLYTLYYQKDSTNKGLTTTTNEHINHSAILESALIWQKKSLAISVEIGDKDVRIYSLKGIGDVCFQQKDYKQAIYYYNQSFAYADSLKQLKEKMTAAKSISDSYKNVKDWEKAYNWNQIYLENKDSVFNEAKNKEIANKELKFDYDKKVVADSVKASEEKKVISAELKQEHTKSYALYGGLALMIVFGGFMFNRFKVTQKQKDIITKEKHRSDELLLNILPVETAEELKSTGFAKAKNYVNVSVLFTDFKGFTSISEQMSPEELVAELHHCFSAFDEIVFKFGLEKIKTIGDSYMCVAGLPKVSEENAIDAVKAGLAIRNFMKKNNEDRVLQGKPVFEIRVGIHSGPVVAGIVGIKKFAYDIWGDTVNTASRMESSGTPGKVNISANTYDLVKDYFSCEYRGNIQAKGKGEMAMYYVERKAVAKV